MWVRFGICRRRRNMVSKWIGRTDKAQTKGKSTETRKKRSARREEKKKQKKQFWQKPKPINADGYYRRTVILCHELITWFFGKTACHRCPDDMRGNSNIIFHTLNHALTQNLCSTQTLYAELIVFVRHSFLSLSFFASQNAHTHSVQPNTAFYVCCVSVDSNLARKQESARGSL